MTKITRILLVTVAFLMITNHTYAVEFGENSCDLDNTYMNMHVVPLGSALIYNGYGTKVSLYSSTNILRIDIVDGVKCVRLHSMRTEKANFSEMWLARDVSSNIYVLKYWDGENSTSVFLGKDGAQLFLPAAPKVGDKVFVDRTVIGVGVTVPVLSSGLGPFTNCLKTVEPDGDIVYIAPGLADVRKDYINEQGGFELQEVIKGAGYSTIDDKLKITVNGFLYEGMNLDLKAVFEYDPNIDPSGLYWKLTELTNN